MLYQAELRSLPKEITKTLLTCKLSFYHQPETGGWSVSALKVSRMTLIISSKLTGFGKNATAPLAVARCLFFSSTTPLMMMMGIFWFHPPGAASP